MSWTKSKNTIYIGLVSLALLLSVDFFFGQRFVLKPINVIDEDPSGQQLRVAHKIFHHTLAKHFNTLGKERDRVCTDGNGFKSACGAKTFREFDIAIIGDSFTEGWPFPYEKTFVGVIAGANPTLRIANLGVVSYSPSIYLVKVRHLINEGYKFDRLHVYVDISDVRDEAVIQTIENGIVVDINDGYVPGPRAQLPDTSMRKRKDRFKSLFPLTYEGLWQLKGKVIKLIRPNKLRGTYLERDYRLSAWTYDTKIDGGYGSKGVDGAIKKSLATMRELYAFTNANNIKLSVGVYPWPGQLLFDDRDSKQVRIWKQFCVDRCEYFFNSFESFFDLVDKYGAERVIRDYYIKGDMHFNERGNRVLAETYFASINSAGAKEK